MVRIPKAEVERLKSEVSLVRLVESQGYELRKQGKDYLLSCPFHEEDTPSLVITPSKNLFNCFGCGASGTVIDWTMKTQAIGFREAVVQLQKEAGLVSDSPIPPAVSKEQPPLAADSSDAQGSASVAGGGMQGATNQAMLKRVIDYYHECLKNSPEALEYLESRGLKHPELIERFKLGYANRSLTHRLPEKNRKAGAEIRGQLQEIGILRKSGHEHFNGSLVVPIFDNRHYITGRSQPPAFCDTSTSLCVEVYGRKIRKDLRKGTPLHLYLPGPHQGVWNIEALKAYKEIILCEALIDAMTFWVHGFRNVTASYGTGGFTDDHLAAFKQYGIERVLIAYDRDEAGNRAAEELAKKLNKEDIDCFRINFPKGMDVNQYALNVTPADKSLELVIRKAEWLGSGTAPSREEIPVAEVVPVATPVPEAPKTVDAEVTEIALAPPSARDTRTSCAAHEVIIRLDNRCYRIRGLAKNTSYEQLKVNVLVSYKGEMHLDTLDLYNAKHRTAYVKQAHVELGVKEGILKKDLGKVLLKLEELRDNRIQKALDPEEGKITLSVDEREQALALLHDKNLLNRVLEHFDIAGVVGEETNKLMGYLACVSRKLDKPLAVIIQSTSAAGKSSLMDAILNMMPEEERVQYSAMTGQSLFYMGETNLKNKILAIAEEEGAENASYALKLLQSEGELTIASTGKDESSGSMVTKEYRVEGPVMLFLTTTAIDIDEELMNRCVVLTVNESREQTQAIHAMQRKQQTLEGLLQNEDRKQLIQLHRNAQRLLRPLLVANPYAEQLTFIDDKTRTRRDHMKYLTLIRAIALLHQYQREVKTVEVHGQALEYDEQGCSSVAGGRKPRATIEYIEVIPSDIEMANQLAHEVLGRTLDELPPQTRKLLKLVHEMVQVRCEEEEMQQSDYRFSRKDIRNATGWGDTQLKIHLARLAEMEYLLVHRFGQAYRYELLYQGADEHGKALAMKLLDAEKLNNDNNRSGLEADRSGLNEQRSGGGRPLVGGQSGGGRTAKNVESPTKTGVNGHDDEKCPEKGIKGKKSELSCRNPASVN